LDELDPFRTSAHADNPERLVFSSKQVVSRELPLLLVTHEEDGDWQFLNGTETDDFANGAVLHIEHVVDEFPEVLELADLPAGWIAWRTEAHAPWQRELRPGE
jgi:hypothetical protein